MSFKNRDVISIKDFSKKEIISILNYAKKMIPYAKGDKHTDILKEKILSSLFFEPSTRTKESFKSAVQKMGGKVLGFDSKEGSSLKKGETLADTISMFAAYADAIVMRHPWVGSAKLASEYSFKPNSGEIVPIINGGDGDNQHPTQTILDLYTIKKELGSLEGKKIALVGDLKYGRTTHSLLYGAAMFDMEIKLVARVRLV